MRGTGADRPVVAMNPGNAGGAKGPGYSGVDGGQPLRRDEPMVTARLKSFDIPQQAVWVAWLRVKANKGAAGVDERSVAAFEVDLKGNLYKLWNRMSSGTCTKACRRWRKTSATGSKSGTKTQNPSYGQDRRRDPRLPRTIYLTNLGRRTLGIDESGALSEAGVGDHSSPERVRGGPGGGSQWRWPGHLGDLVEQIEQLLAPPYEVSGR